MGYHPQIRMHTRCNHDTEKSVPFLTAGRLCASTGAVHNKCSLPVGVVQRGSIGGLDHGVGRPCSLWSIRRLVAADSEALVGDQRMPKSPQTSTAVSDGKTALRPSCRLRASEKSCEWPSDTHAFSGGLILAVDGSSVTGTRCVLPHWNWSAGTPRRAWRRAP
jgi:hypothetical protein